MSRLLLQDGQTYIFMGDSITDAGRRNEATPFGVGYAAMTRGLLHAVQPELQVRFHNQGISGNTTVELEERWEEDVLALRPDWMSVLIGINDCFQYLGGREEVGPEHYEPRYRSLLRRTVEASGCRLILLEPFLFTTPDLADENQRRGWDLLPRYLESVHRLAEEFGARLIRTHDLGQQILRQHTPDLLCPEPVHPSTTGHALIAWHLLSALLA